MPEVLAIIPVRGRDVAKTGGMPTLGDRPLIAHTIGAAKAAQTVTRVMVWTDDAIVQQLAIALGAEAPVLRSPGLAQPGVPLEQVLQDCVRELERREGYRPAVIVQLEMSHPFREPGLIDRVVRTLLEQELDTVFTAYEDRHAFWKVGADQRLEPISDERVTRAARPPLYKEISGLVCAIRADVVRAGQRLGRRVGVVPLTGLEALVDTQDESGLELARKLYDEQ